MLLGQKKKGWASVLECFEWSCVVGKRGDSEKKKSAQIIRSEERCVGGANPSPVISQALVLILRNLGKGARAWRDVLNSRRAGILSEGRGGKLAWDGLKGECARTGDIKGIFRRSARLSDRKGTITMKWGSSPTSEQKEGEKGKGKSPSAPKKGFPRK